MANEEYDEYEDFAKLISAEQQLQQNDHLEANYSSLLERNRECFEKEYTIMAEQLQVCDTEKLALSKEAKQQLDMLVDLMATLKLGRLRKYSLLKAIMTIQKEEQHLAEQNNLLDSRIKMLTTRKSRMNNLVTSMAKVKQEYEESMPDIKRKSMEWQQNAGLLKHKTSDYQNRIAQMQDSYSNIEAEIIRAKEMLVKSKALEDLKIKVVEESSKLSSYKNLPADVTLAKVKVAEKRQEYEELKKQRDEILMKMNVLF